MTKGEGDPRQKSKVKKVRPLLTIASGRMFYRLAFVVLLALSKVAASAITSQQEVFVKRSDLPQGNWVTLEEGGEFLFASEHSDALDSERAALLRSVQHRFLGYKDQLVDGAETYYDDFSQAWRLVGFYIDCHAVEQGYHEERALQDNEEEGGACLRFLLWAAYVDLDYQGGGIGEYQYYDRKNGLWDRSACRKHGNRRCARMDCHLPDTHFSLLGYFKEPNFGSWMEQLFKHQGVCLWTDDEYEFMQAGRVSWPVYCTNSYQKDENDNYLYFDVRPLNNARIDIGLYTDERCSVDYRGKVDVNDVLEAYYEDNSSTQNGGGSRDYSADTVELSDSIQQWNDAFDIYTICQPCKAYNLGYIPDDEYNQQNRDHGEEDGTNTDEANGGYFVCDDDADYRNVNQCMKFRTKTDMYNAEVRDLMLAAEQGTITQFSLGEYTYGEWIHQGGKDWLVAAFSMIVMVVAAWMLYRAYKKLNDPRSPYSEPFMPSKEGVMS
jgi:hypothetical protein